MFNLLAILTILACGDKTGTDTGSAVDDNESTENGSNGSNGSGENGDDTTETGTEGGDPDADPNEDADGDGFIGAEDCDDSDPYTYPGAMEFPGDGVDQDCDGEEPFLKDAGRALSNPSFDLETNGAPTDWKTFGDGFAWQADGDEIVTTAGMTGQTFESHSGVGALKLWGDYGTSPFGNGESVVYQEFLPNGTWTWSDTTFWIDGWVMVHSTAPLQGDASFSLGIRCVEEFYGSKSVIKEQFSDAITTESTFDTWVRVWAEVSCPMASSSLEAVIRFVQPNMGAESTDHGVVYVDDVAFGIVQ